MSETKHTFRNMADKLFHKDATHQETKEMHSTEHTLAKEKTSDAMGMHVEDSKMRTETIKAPLVVESSAAFQAGGPIVHTRTFAPVVKTCVKGEVLEQTVRTETIVEVQPVIHRVVEAPEVHIIEKHIYETVPTVGPHTVTKQAIIEETVKPRIIEEIQPVLHRDVPAPFIKHVEEHISERQVRPTVYTKEVINEKREYTAEEAISKGFVTPYKAEIAKEPTLHSHREATLIDTHLNATIVEQTTRPEKITEIQPIIHREVDAPEVHTIEKHVHESVPMTAPKIITKQAIVEEEIHPTIIEEIRPIIHRELPQMVVEKREEHTTESVVAPTIQSKEILSEKRVGEAVALLPEAHEELSAPLIVSATAKASVTSNMHNIIVEETARPEEVVEIQPIIHKNVEAPEVHVIERHIHEAVPSVGPKQITKTAIIEETILPKVLEEIKPVLHREVPVAVVEHVEEHLKENVVLEATETKEVFIDGEKVLDADISKDMSSMSLKKL